VADESVDLVRGELIAAAEGAQDPAAGLALPAEAIFTMSMYS
jgi:hypothetical protein